MPQPKDDTRLERRSMKECRVLDAIQTELRIDEDSREIVGKIPYNTETVIGGIFREVIRSEFFTRAIKERDDVVAWAGHGEGGSLPFARTTVEGGAGNLRLIDRGDHLEWRATSVDARDVDDLLVRVRAGVIDATSFAFVADDQDPEQVHWDRSETKDGKLPLRELLSASRIFDVSPVVFAAYDNTSVGLRSAESIFNDHLQSLEGQAPEGDDDLKPAGLEPADAREVAELIT